MTRKTNLSETLYSASKIFCHSGFYFQCVIKAGADVAVAERGVKRAVVKIPSQSPAPDEVTFSTTTVKFLQNAQYIQKSQKVRVGILYFVMYLQPQNNLKFKFVFSGEK